MMSDMLLGQQELVVPAPVRRLVVPEGHSAWWGVDPSTTRVAVAYVGPDGSRGVRTAPFARIEGPARLSEIYAQTRLFVAGDAATFFPVPGVVLVEQPSGKSENPNLSYAVGVVLAAVYDGLREAYGRAVALETVVSGHWKKVACGRGNVYKPTKKALGRSPLFEDYGVAVWARENGYDGTSWDECDALGIAVAASREIALEQR
jgi:hypothetical protein